MIEVQVTSPRLLCVGLLRQNGMERREEGRILEHVCDNNGRFKNQNLGIATSANNRATANES